MLQALAARQPSIVAVAMVLRINIDVACPAPLVVATLRRGETDAATPPAPEALGRHLKRRTVRSAHQSRKYYEGKLIPSLRQQIHVPRPRSPTIQKWLQCSPPPLIAFSTPVVTALL